MNEEEKELFYNNRSILLIKNDTEAIQKVLESLGTHASLMILPHISLFCNESINFLDSTIDTSVFGDPVINYSQVRSKLKLFSSSYGKSINQIKIADNTQNNEFKNQLRFKWMKSFNIHYNLGIYRNSEGHIIGNTQYVSYILQNKSFDLAINSSQELYDFSTFLGSIIGMITKYLTPFFDSSIQKKTVENFSSTWLYCDVNTNKKFNKFVNLEEGKEITLHLLHLVTAINFVYYELPLHIEKYDPWLLRIKYITAYYVNQSLESLNKKKIATLYFDLDTNNFSVFSSKFRSCMMHYSFYNKGECIVDDRYVQDSTFCGLIETCFDGKNFSQYEQLLNDKIRSLSQTLEAIFTTTLKGYKVL